MEYFLFVCIFFIFVIIHNNLNENKEIIYIYFFFVLFVALALGFRGNEDEYTRIYVLYPSLGNFFLEENSKYIFDKGFLFALIIAVLKSLNLNSQSLFIFFCFSSVFINAIYFRKYTEYFFLAFMLYMSHGIIFKEWVGLRMGLASALLLPMIYYLYYGNKLKFFLLATIATLIQYVGILSFLLIFLNRKINPILLILGLIFATFFYYYGVTNFIIEYLNDRNYIPEQASIYLVENPYVYDVGLSHPKTIQQIITLLIFILLFGFKKELPFKYYNLIFNAYYLSTFLIISFASHALFAFRFASHFYAVEPILVTYFIYIFRQRFISANILTIFALIIAYINYVYYAKVKPYDLFINYPY